MSTITASACLSTSVTKSFTPLLSTCTFSMSSDARLMTAPAARAALMAMLSIGWSDWDMDFSKWLECGTPHGAPARAGETLGDSDERAGLVGVGRPWTALARQCGQSLFYPARFREVTRAPAPPSRSAAVLDRFDAIHP